MTIDTRDAPDPEEQPPPSDVPVAEEVLSVPATASSDARVSESAGEHCSLYHAWIQGALESGIRAAQEIHEAP